MFWEASVFFYFFIFFSLGFKDLQMPLSLLTALLVKCKGKQDHIFYPCPIIPFVQSAAQIPS